MSAMWSSGDRKHARVRIGLALTATCVGGFAFALVVAAPGSTQTPALSTPSVPLPSVTLPTVTLPVTVPTVTLPTSTTTTTSGGGTSTTTTTTTTTTTGGATEAGGTARCRFRGARPDAHCTPGYSVRMTRQRACAHRRRLAAPAAAVRQAVLADYGIAAADARLYAVDRLVADGLGGTNARRNLWPARLRSPGAREKRWLETRLLNLVCSGRMTLAAARRAETHDWLAAYRRLHR